MIKKLSYFDISGIITKQYPEYNLDIKIYEIFKRILIGLYSITNLGLGLLEIYKIYEKVHKIIRRVCF